MFINTGTGAFLAEAWFNHKIYKRISFFYGLMVGKSKGGKADKKDSKQPNKVAPAKPDKKLTDKERVDQGQVLCRAIIEVLGAPKEYVEEAVTLVVDKIRETPYFEVVSEETFEAEEKGKLFSTFSEVEIWFTNVDALSKFVFDFTPSSIEVLQPSEVSLKANFLNGFFNDFLLKIHESGMKIKDNSAQLQLLQKNTDTLVRNIMNFMISSPRSSEEIAKLVGIPKENTEAILANYIKVGIAELKDGKYIKKDKK